MSTLSPALARAFSRLWMGATRNNPCGYRRHVHRACGRSHTHTPLLSRIGSSSRGYCVGNVDRSVAPRPQPKDHTMSENIEDLKAPRPKLKPPRRRHGAEGNRATEALRLQPEAAGAANASPRVLKQLRPRWPARRPALYVPRSKQPKPPRSVSARSEAAQASSEVSGGFSLRDQAAYSWDVPRGTIGTLIGGQTRARRECCDAGPHV